MEIYQSTELAQKKTAGEIPYELMTPGTSVFVPDDVKEGSLRSVVSHAGRKYNKAFKVVRIKQHKVYEVACVDDLSFAAKAAYKIVESSPETKAKFNLELGGSKKYPFEKLTEGLSFIVPIAEGNEDSIRVQCSTWGKKLGKKFVFHKHENHGVFEIGCIPTKPIQFFPVSDELTAKGEPTPVVSPAKAFTAAPQHQFFPPSEETYEVKHDWEE